MLARLKRYGIDPYLVLLFATVAAAALLPAGGDIATVLKGVSYWAVALLFFLYGAKLSTASILAGLTNWRLQLGILATTFVVFPVLGLGLAAVAAPLLGAAFAAGLIYVGCLPSTIQSAVAFTALARGNVAGAVCAASISNLIGVVLSPLLVSLLLTTEGPVSINPDAVWKIAQQILLPFFLGQLARPLLIRFLDRYKSTVTLYDRGVILLIVYVAFSAGITGGTFATAGAAHLAALGAVVAVMLALAFAATILIGRVSGMDRADRATMLFCGSTKSLATGLPMAGILFLGQDVAAILLPLMLYHLLQLVVCALIAQRMAAVPEAVAA
ncbi:MAG: bile acid:sodium symporter [Rhodobacteraceae bacterium]|nr:bile acid:sodium symporter [Paracoccaceae bacterium]